MCQYHQNPISAWVMTSENCAPGAPHTTSRLDNSSESFLPVDLTMCRECVNLKFQDFLRLVNHFKGLVGLFFFFFFLLTSRVLFISLQYVMSKFRGNRYIHSPFKSFIWLKGHLPLIRWPLSYGWNNGH